MEELLYTVSECALERAQHAVDALSQFLLSLVVAFVEPVKVGALPAAVRAHGGCVARAPHCELRLLEPAGFEGRLQIHRRARGQSHLGLSAVGVAVLGLAVAPPLQAAEVQLRVRVLHAMVGRLEVLQDVLTCQAQLPLRVGIEHAAVDVGRVVGDAIFGRVLAVRLRLWLRVRQRGLRCWLGVVRGGDFLAACQSSPSRTVGAVPSGTYHGRDGELAFHGGQLIGRIVLCMQRSEKAIRRSGRWTGCIYVYDIL